MNFPFYIARRYLFSKKKHNAINIISGISVCGVALATLALVCTLSVFNGFQDMVASFFTAFDPQLKITVREGKVFDAQDERIRAVCALPEVEVFTETLEENAMVQYKDRQAMVVLKGVEDNFEELTAIDSILYGAGEFVLHDSIVNYGVMGVELVATLGTGLEFVDPLQVYLPKRNAKVNMANPGYTEGCEVCVEIPYLEKSISVSPSITSMPDKVPALEEEGEPAGYSLLVVEDTTDMLEFLAKNLGNTYTIHTAANGKEALECLETTTVDLIISDIVMPHMDGFELLKSIRSDNMLCHIPFILLSALDSIDSKIAGLDYGADAYIEKPFSLSHMKATINNLLENRRMLFNHFTTVPNMSYDQTLMNKTDVKWLNTINEIITRNFTNEEFTIDKMAEEMAISRSNLQRKLKGLTGMPPNDYIRLIRLKTAGELLRKGEYRINEVCFIVGFNNPSYFARCFQKQFGILPKDYVKGGDITHSQKGTTSISP